MAGFGTQAAGRSNAAFGTPGTAAAFGGGILRNTATGARHDARLIDPVTRDYVLDEDNPGRLLGMSATKQGVLLSVGTERYSSAVRLMGQELRKIDRITPNFERRVLDKLIDALQPLIDTRQIAVLGFTTFKAGPKDGLAPGQTYGRLRWKDLTTDAEYEELV